MEAKALSSFTARSEDELSFEKGTILKIVKVGEGWHRAELDGKMGLVPETFVSIRHKWWFQPGISREEARQRLQTCQEGMFLIRECEDSPGDFELCFRSKGGVQHLKVLIDGSGKYFLWIVKFDSLNDLVKYHKTASVCRGETIFLRDPEISTGLFDFDAKEENELSFKAGDQIMVVSKVDSNWWQGLHNGKVGLFPSSYVK